MARAWLLVRPQVTAAASNLSQGQLTALALLRTPRLLRIMRLLRILDRLKGANVSAPSPAAALQR